MNGNRVATQRAFKWLRLNNHLYPSFAANYETLLRFQSRQRGQPKSLQIFRNVDFQPVSSKLTKTSILESDFVTFTRSRVHMQTYVR